MGKKSRVVRGRNLKMSTSAIEDYERGIRPINCFSMKNYNKLDLGLDKYPFTFIKKLTQKYCRVCFHHAGQKMSRVQFYDIKLLLNLSSDKIQEEFLIYSQFHDLKNHEDYRQQLHKETIF